MKVQNLESGKATWKPNYKSGKKKKKQKKVCFVKEDLRVKQSANGSDWPMFKVSDSHGKCKEFIVPVTMSLSMGIYEEIEDAKINERKNEDLKNKAKISLVSYDVMVALSLIFNLAFRRIQLKH